MQVIKCRQENFETGKEKIIFFQSGLPGFEYLCEFVLVPLEANQIFWWLQSVQQPEIALLVVNPFIFFPDYNVDLPEIIAKEIEIENLEETLVLTTVTILGDDLSKVTTNLVGPIIINTRLSKGKQVILENSSYNIKQPLFKK